VGKLQPHVFAGCEGHIHKVDNHHPPNLISKSQNIKMKELATAENIHIIEKKHRITGPRGEVSPLSPFHGPTMPSCSFTPKLTPTYTRHIPDKEKLVPITFSRPALSYCPSLGSWPMAQTNHLVADLGGGDT